MSDANKVWLTAHGMPMMFTLPLDLNIEKQVRKGELTRVNEDGSPFAGDPYEALGDGVPPVVPGVTGETRVGDSIGGGITQPATPPAAGDGGGQGDGPETPDGPVRPAQDANKPEWVAYAVALGLYESEKAANAKTKPELVEETAAAEQRAEKE